MTIKITLQELKGNEAVKNMKINAEIILNIHGDEPFINPNQIKELIKLLNENTEIGTLAKNTANEFLNNPNNPKFLIRMEMLSIFRNIKILKKNTITINILEYICYRMEILNKICELKETYNEREEN